MNKPQKIPYTAFIQSFTPFYINNAFDRQVISSINNKLRLYKEIIPTLKNYDAINNFLKNYPEGLNLLLIISGISTEKFKRIVSALRIERGDIFKTEWDIKRCSKEITKGNFFAKEIIEMFLYGNESHLATKLPDYYLENVSLNEETLGFLVNDNYLKRQLKSIGDGKYNNDVGDKVEDEIKKVIDDLGAKYGVTYSREKFVQWINRNMDFCLPNEHDPYVIIESSFQVTTGSGQTTKRNDEVKASEEIRRHNIQKGKNIAFVNLCDGAGWLARQADLKRIYDCSDYVINLKNLNLLEEIILYHIPSKYLSAEAKI